MTYTSHMTLRRCTCLATCHGSGGRRRSADAELWRPCKPDVARGDRAESGASPYRPLSRAGARPVFNCLAAMKAVPYQRFDD